MAPEQGLYGQVVMIHTRESDNKKKNIRHKNLTSKGNQQEQKLVWSCYEWVKKNFMAREPDFYKNYFKLNLGVIIQKKQIFGVPIGNAKTTINVQFHPSAPVINITRINLIVVVCVV